MGYWDSYFIAIKTECVTGSYFIAIKTECVTGTVTLLQSKLNVLLVQLLYCNQN
jgi:hypothetical protein